MNQQIGSLFLASVLMLLPAVVHAGAPNAAATEARKLFEDAAQDMADGAFGRACPKLEAALKILPEHVRTAMFLAECFDKWGKPASALKVLEITRPLAVSQDKPEKAAEIDKSVADLNARVSKVRIIVPDDITRMPGLTILGGGLPIIAMNWGKTMPVNPGTYDVEVSALDKSTWKTTVDVKPGQTIEVTLTPTWSQAGRSGPITTPDEPNVVKPNVVTAPPLVTETRSAKPSGRRIAGFIGIGIGIAGMGIGAGLGGAAISKNDASDAGLCNAKNECNQAGYDLRIAAQNLGNTSTGLMIAGGLLLAGGVTLVALTPSKSEGTRASVWIGPGGFGLRGQW